MKLEVGMYTRHKPLLSHNYIKIDKIKEIEEKENCLHIWLEDKDLITEKHLIKASHSIIELVQVGDYVNGYKITLIYNEKLFTDEYLFDDVEGEFNRIYFNKDEIKTIVTKEQMESMRYVVNENS